MKWYNSLIFKISLCCVILTFCLFGSIFGVLYRYQQSILFEMEQKSSEILEEIQVELTNLEVEEISGDVLENRFENLDARHGVEAVILYDSENNIVSSARSKDTPPLEFGDPMGYFIDVPGRGGGKVTRYVQAFPLMVGESRVGYVDIRLDIAPQTHLVRALQSKILLALVLLFLGAMGALCYFVFRLLLPFHMMAATCQEISEGNLREIDIRPNASEVLVLEMKFNEMIGALKKKAEMEQKLAQAGRLSAMGNLAAGIAHEIGNPLNAIKLTVSHLKDMASRRELDGSTFETYSDGILNEVNRLDKIVRDFLTLAKERELVFQPYGIDKLLRETVRLIEKDAQKRGIDIHSNIPACAEEALIDSQMLKGAILNILLNAMEASEKDRVISVTLEESDGDVVIRVADQGKGIPEEIMDRVFEPYFTTKTSGTGLGLSLTRTIIEKHNGDISLESRRGQGTTVSITIPAGSK